MRLFERRERHLRAVAAVERAQQAIVIARRHGIVFVVVKLVEASADFLFLHRDIVQNGVCPGHNETGGGDCERIVRFKFITGQLPAHKRVERQIVIEAADNEIAIMVRRGAVRVAFLSIAIGVANHVQPMPRPAFSVMRAGQQFIDQRLRRGSRVVREFLDKRIDLFRRWRQPREIEIDPAHQLARVGAWRGRQLLSLKPGENETIDRRAPSAALCDRRQRRTSQRKVRPMLAVLIGHDHFRSCDDAGRGGTGRPFGAALDPTLEQINLRGRQRFAFRGHPLLLVVGGNQFD